MSLELKSPSRFQSPSSQGGIAKNPIFVFADLEYVHDIGRVELAIQVGVAHQSNLEFGLREGGPMSILQRAALDPRIAGECNGRLKLESRDPQSLHRSVFGSRITAVPGEVNGR